MEENQTITNKLQENTYSQEEWKFDIEKIQKDLFTVVDTTEQNNERQERFNDFLEFREIK